MPFAGLANPLSHFLGLAREPNDLFLWCVFDPLEHNALAAGAGGQAMSVQGLLQTFGRSPLHPIVAAVSSMLCPMTVINGPPAARAACPFYPQEQTVIRAIGMASSLALPPGKLSFPISLDLLHES